MTDQELIGDFMQDTDCGPIQVYVWHEALDYCDYVVGTLRRDAKGILYVSVEDA